MTTEYRDDFGNAYREAGHMPYSELTPGDAYALASLPGRVYVRAAGKPLQDRGLARDSFAYGLCAALLHSTVILLERIDTPEEGF